MESGGLTLLQRSLGQGQGTIVMIDGGPDFSLDQNREGGDRGVAQNQNGIAQACPPQFHGFQHGGHAEETAFILKQPGNLNGAVAIGICLDDGHELLALAHELAKVVAEMFPVDMDVAG